MSDLNEKKVILLADDDTDDTELFSEAISHIDKSVIIHQTPNGKIALAKLDELGANVDIIFLDINMPVMNGWECLKALKADERYKRIPVVIYSSSSNHREKQIAMDLGATEFFTKPDDFYVFREKLKILIGQIGSGDGHLSH